jgi:hypothetical protein
VQRADDGHAGSGGFERVVMPKLAGQIQIGFLSQGVG